MNKEEIIKDFVNSDTFEIIEDYISKPYIETINELENNWNELKEWLENELDIQKSLNAYGFIGIYQYTINKMQEIEKKQQ
jgi:hypothetical protein